MAEKDLGIARATIQRMLKNNNFYNFKFSSVTAIRSDDPVPIMKFCGNMLICVQEAYH